MRRTYRSKKDTGGVLDRRDLLLNLDEKSSAYDAFFIQNIKQTKRELSCVGSSNTYGVASKQVRKRKYVKRIVKEPETPCRESLSRSAYLTPDKSIRVNKPMDPFDMLLNSSPACQVEVRQENIESVARNVEVFEQIGQKKEAKTYRRRKPVKTKKQNYSSSESDSDKENSDNQASITQNTSDIKAYQLLIEHELKTTPKRFNDSINNIVNNLSLLNRLKHKNSFNDCMKRPLSYYKNRLTRNIQSPILQKSPLCSTPFKAKYRGESIYKFSPISMSNNNSPKYTTITEDNDNSNNSIMFLGTNNTQSIGNSKEIICTPHINVSPNNNNTKCDADSVVINVEISKDQDEVFHKDGSNYESEHLEIVNKTNATSSVEVSSLQTTEAEPFFGFSDHATTKMSTEDNIIQRISHLDDTHLRNDITEIEATENSYNVQEIKESDASTGDNVVKEDSNTTSQSIDDDKDSLYDTCTSEQSSIDDEEVIKEPIVQMQRMNDSSFLRYYKKMNNFSSDGDETTESVEEDNDENIINSRDDVLSQKEEFASFEDSSVSNEDTDSEGSHSYIDENGSYIIEQLSDNEQNRSGAGENSLNIHKNGSYTIERVSDNEENGSDIEGNELDIEENGTQEENHTQEEKLGDYLLANETGDYVDILSSNDEDVESDEEEKCISFVTTRRRNEVTNNSMMSIFNDSYASSSTDCDKTVLSNYKVPEKPDDKHINNDVLDENDTLVDLNIDGQNSDGGVIVKLDSEMSTDRLSYSHDSDNTRISFVTTRNSNVTDRKSSIKTRKSSIKSRRNISSIRKSSKLPEDSIIHSPEPTRKTCFEKPVIVLQPGKKWERSLSIYRRITMMTDHFDHSILEDEPSGKKGRKYRQSVISTMEMQELNGSLHNESINSRRSTFVSKPSRSTIRIVKDPDISRLSLSNTTVFDDLKGFLNEECDDTIIELSKLSIADQPHEVTVLNTFHDTSSRLSTARDYVLRRCSQADAILFDECYPDSVLKNCHKIGEGVYGEVFLWRDRDGRARVLKIVPIAGTLKVNGESQKDFHEIISEIVIAMELSALRAPIAEINRHFDEGKDVDALDLHAIENATDIFNEVLAVRCVYGSYPARLLDLWDLYDECKGSENDNPAILPPDQQFIVLELANAGQDLESYQFNNAEQAYALFLQVAYGLAVAEEAFQFEHRDLHWGNVLIAPTEQKYSTFVLRGRSYRVARCGVAATIIDYSLSRVSLPLAGGECAALYNDLATDDSLFDAVGDYQFEVYRLMRDKLGNDWKNFAPYTNILWLHYTVDKMITALRYKRTNTKIHKHYIEKLKGIKSRILDYGSAALFVLTDNEI